MTLPSLGLLLICVPVCVSSGACPQLLLHHHKGWKKWQQKRNGMDVWNWRSDLHHCRWMEQGREGKGRVGSGRVMNSFVGSFDRIWIAQTAAAAAAARQKRGTSFRFCIDIFFSFQCFAFSATLLLLLPFFFLPLGCTHFSSVSASASSTFHVVIRFAGLILFLIFSSLAAVAAAHPVPSGLLVWYYFFPFIFPFPIFSSHVTARKVCLLCVCCAVVCWAANCATATRESLLLNQRLLCVFSLYEPVNCRTHCSQKHTHTHFLVSKFGSRLLFFFFARNFCPQSFSALFCSALFTHSLVHVPPPLPLPLWKQIQSFTVFLEVIEFFSGWERGQKKVGVIEWNCSRWWWWWWYEFTILLVGAADIFHWSKQADRENSESIYLKSMKIWAVWYFWDFYFDCCCCCCCCCCHWNENYF